MKARVSDALKDDVRALALMRGDDENESLIVREALMAYLRQPDVAGLLEEGRRRLAELRAQERHGEPGAGDGV